MARARNRTTPFVESFLYSLRTDLGETFARFGGISVGGILRLKR